MIEFDYSFKTNKFNELKEGDFFLIDNGREDKLLYIKHYSLSPKNFLMRSEDLPTYNCYSLTMRRFENLDFDATVIECNVNISVKPITG